MTPWPVWLLRRPIRVLSLARRVLGWRSVSAARAAFWRDAARDVKLTRIEERADGLCGWSGSLHVGLAPLESERGTRIRFSGFPGSLTLRPEGADTSWRRLRGAREIEVGDPDFDREVWVEGPPLVVRAILDPPTRLALRALFQGRLERPRLDAFAATGHVEGGVLTIDALDSPSLPSRALPREEGLIAGYPQGSAAVEVAGLAGTGGAHFRDALRAALALASRLVAPADPAKRVAENLKNEPLASVRYQCLTALVREQPDHPAARQAVLASRADPDAEVRLRAGAASGADGHPILLSLALGEGAEDATTERAVAVLGDSLSTEQAATILRNALRTRREATAQACLRLLGFRGGPEAIRMLARVLGVERGPLAEAAAHALALTGDPAAEQPLLEALGSPDDGLRVAAARALGRAGTAAAVAPLRELEEHDRAVRATARQAVAQIQARLAGAGPGQLSLADGGAGALSFADDAPGRLSFANGSAGIPAPGGEAPRPAGVRKGGR